MQVSGTEIEMKLPLHHLQDRRSKEVVSDKLTSVTTLSMISETGLRGTSEMSLDIVKALITNIVCSFAAHPPIVSCFLVYAIVFLLLALCSFQAKRNAFVP